jgi:hypothetical protein
MWPDNEQFGVKGHNKELEGACEEGSLGEVVPEDGGAQAEVPEA